MKFSTDSIFLNAYRYAFTSDSGQEIEGVTMNLFDPTSKGDNDHTDGSINKVTCSIDFWLQVKVLPALSSVTATLNYNGKKLQLLEIEQTKEFDPEEMINNDN